MTADLTIQASAEFSACREHRHVLSRWWSAAPRALVCGCNPSDAGEERNDPTVRATIALLRGRPGIGGFDLVNFGTRITSSPRAFDLWRADAWSRDPLAYERAGAENHAQVRRLSQSAAVRIVAWGNLVRWSFEVQRLLDALTLGGAHPLLAFALTKDGAPRHPLARGRERIPLGLPLVVWHATPLREAA